MTTVTAHTIMQLRDELIIVCTLCKKIHVIPATTGRLTPVPAACDPGKTYIVGATMKEKTVVSAIKNHDYDINRKRRYYDEHVRKSRSPDHPGEAPDPPAA